MHEKPKITGEEYTADIDPLETAIDEDLLRRVLEDDFAAVSPEEILQARDLRRVLEEVVASLEPRQRDVIRLLFFQGKTEEEAGKTLHISDARVGQIKKSALSALRYKDRLRKLKEAGAGDPNTRDIIETSSILPEERQNSPKTPF